MRSVFLCVLFSWFTAQIPAHASLTLVSNSSNPKSEENSFFSNYSLYQAFTVGSADATIQSITVNFGYLGNASGVAMSIFSDSAGRPGSSLSSLTPNGPPGMMMNQDFTFSGALNVVANTSYWVVLSATGGTDDDGNSPMSSWNYVSITAEPLQDGQGGWTIANSHFEGSLGSPTEYPGNPILMTISGVPEPSSGSLVWLGLGVAIARRRKGRVARGE